MAALRLRLREILAKRNLSQRDLSRMTGISENSISRLSSGALSIRMESIDAICTALEIQPGELFNYKKSPDH